MNSLKNILITFLLINATISVHSPINITDCYTPKNEEFNDIAKISASRNQTAISSTNKNNYHINNVNNVYFFDSNSKIFNVLEQIADNPRQSKSQHIEDLSILFSLNNKELSQLITDISRRPIEKSTHMFETILWLNTLQKDNLKHKKLIIDLICKNNDMSVRLALTKLFTDSGNEKHLNDIAIDIVKTYSVYCTMYEESGSWDDILEIIENMKNDSIACAMFSFMESSNITSKDSSVIDNIAKQSLYRVTEYIVYTLIYEYLQKKEKNINSNTIKIKTAKCCTCCIQ